jgi:predicted NBD/HSP70 family sugar kinase
MGSQMDKDQITWDEICETVKAGDKTALNVINEAAFYLSAGLVNIINTINPEAVVIGGAAINTCGILYDFAVSLAKEKLKNLNGTVSFLKGTYGEDEIAVGAATLILDYYLGKEVSEIVLGSA